MIARLYVQLPFRLVLPKDAQFDLWGYENDGLKFQIELPKVSEDLQAQVSSHSIRLNGAEGIYTDVLTINFLKDSFERSADAPCDPAEEVIEGVVKAFLERLKYVVKSSQVKIPDFKNYSWNLTYLNDDGSDLAEEPGKIMSRGGITVRYSWIWCDPFVWDGVQSLPPDFAAPEWRTLLTDAHGALPHIGTAVVLACASLEVFIAHILKNLQVHAGIPGNLWSFINDRQPLHMQPTVDEQYSALLEIGCGHSLKSETDLWRKFLHLRNARNKFVHEGVAAVEGRQINVKDAADLLRAAETIVLTIRGWLPDHLQWPLFERGEKWTVEITQNFGSVTEAETSE